MTLQAEVLRIVVTCGMKFARDDVTKGRDVTEVADLVSLDELEVRYPKHTDELHRALASRPQRNK